MTDKTDMTKKMSKPWQTKWETKLKWQKNDKNMTNKMTDKIEMTNKMTTKTAKNDKIKINIWTISRVWLRVSSKACCLAPSQRSSPQAICTASSPSRMLSRSLPAKLSPSYFHGLPPSEALRKLLARFLLRPACCLAPSQRSSPQASYFHGFLSVRHAVSLPTSEALRKLSVQHAVSLPPSHTLRKLFARLPIRPACCLAPSERSSPQAISTVSCPSSMLSRSLPAKLSLPLRQTRT